jgi:transcriptional regulator with XRE-family HTH domain
MHQSFGALVTQARKEHNLDQDELCSILGIDESTLSKIENGHRPLYADELLALALVFKDWFEFQTENFTEDIMADLAARVREFLDKTSFTADQFGKLDWFKALLRRLDHLDVPTIEA